MSALLDRFWSRVNTKAPNGCWEWTAARSKGGYGQIRFGTARVPGSRLMYAHRLSWQISTRRSIPDGMTIDHLCRNTACVNPDHLDLVTHRENMRRGIGFSGVNARKTHCKRGHPLSGANLYVRPNGGRNCRACMRMMDRRLNQATDADRALVK